jgi:Zn-dependent peptidase ImmA (M78 family)
LLHSKKAVSIDANGDDIMEVEQQANDFAASILIPKRAYSVFVNTGDFSRASIKKFASRQGVAPGIVVGRLQHEKLVKYSMRNDLKERLEWAA